VDGLKQALVNGMVLTVRQLLCALRAQGEKGKADMYEQKIFGNFAEHVSPEDVYDLTVDEAAFLIRINVLLKGSEEQKRTAEGLISQVYDKAMLDLDSIDKLRLAGGNSVVGSDYVLDLQRRGFSSVDVKKCLVNQK